jgi:hypothetical protein
MIFELRTYQIQAGKAGEFLRIYQERKGGSAQRAKLAGDAAWQAFVPTILPYLVHQESTLMTPAAFSPMT